MSGSSSPMWTTTPRHLPNRCMRWAWRKTRRSASSSSPSRPMTRMKVSWNLAVFLSLWDAPVVVAVSGGSEVSSLWFHVNFSQTDQSLWLSVQLVIKTSVEQEIRCVNWMICCLPLCLSPLPLSAVSFPYFFIIFLLFLPLCFCLDDLHPLFSPFCFSCLNPL